MFIALNVGLKAGLIGPRFFAVLVLMALITTVATAPMLTVLKARARPAEERHRRRQEGGRLAHGAARAAGTLSAEAIATPAVMSTPDFDKRSTGCPVT